LLELFLGFSFLVGLHMEGFGICGMEYWGWEFIYYYIGGLDEVIVIIGVEMVK
jgi:hypothetical protein